MGYLIIQIIICLLIAAIIGFTVGWLLRGLTFVDNKTNNKFSSRQPQTSSRGQTNDEVAEPVTIAPSISHRIDKIGGIEKGVIKMLQKEGINTTKDLIKKCSNRQGIKHIVSVTGSTESIINQWVSTSDLMCIPSVNGKIAHLISACGIKSTKALVNVDPQALVIEMQKVNQRELIVPETVSLPDLSKTTQIIKDAKTL